MLLPGLAECFQAVATGGIGIADTLGARTNAEDPKHTSEVLGGEATVYFPRTRGKRLDPLHDDGGGEASGVAVMGEAIADSGQELQAGPELEGGFFGEEAKEGFAEARRPGTANSMGQLQERLTHILLAGREAGRKGVVSIGRQFFQEGHVLFGPGGEALTNGHSLEFGAGGIEAFEGEKRSR